MRWIRKYENGIDDLEPETEKLISVNDA